jgi:hypothetical protein
MAKFRFRLPLLQLAVLSITLTGICPQVAMAACPDDVEVLVDQLLTDLPNYANRVLSKSRPLELARNSRNYVLIAGQPEFEPLTLSGGYRPTETEVAPPQQLFFTTLERIYLGNEVSQVQNYHWLFLTQTNSGWRVVTMYSRIGSSERNRPPLPPTESSNGAIGRGIRLWLRDCRAGVL